MNSNSFILLPTATAVRAGYGIRCFFRNGATSLYGFPWKASFCALSSVIMGRLRHRKRGEIALRSSNTCLRRSGRRLSRIAGRNRLLNCEKRPCSILFANILKRRSRRFPSILAFRAQRRTGRLRHCALQVDWCERAASVREDGWCPTPFRMGSTSGAREEVRAEFGADPFVISTASTAGSISSMRRSGFGRSG